MGRKKQAENTQAAQAADVSQFLDDLGMAAPDDLPPEGDEPSLPPVEDEADGPPQSAPTLEELGEPATPEKPAEPTEEGAAEKELATLREFKSTSEKEIEGLKKILANLVGSSTAAVAPPQSQPAPAMSGQTASPAPVQAPPTALDAMNLLGDFDPREATREEWAQYLYTRDRRIMEQTLLHAAPLVSDIYDQKDMAVRLLRDHLDNPENAWVRGLPEEVFFAYLDRANKAHPGQHPRDLLQMATTELAEHYGRAQSASPPPTTQPPATAPKAEVPSAATRPASKPSRSDIGKQIDSMLMGFEPGSGRL